MVENAHAGGLILQAGEGVGERRDVFAAGVHGFGGIEIDDAAAFLGVDLIDFVLTEEDLAAVAQLVQATFGDEGPNFGLGLIQMFAGFLECVEFVGHDV